MFKYNKAYAITLNLLAVNAYADVGSYTHQSGATVVDINKPNASGLSHNLYKNFDVSSTGMILNNSTSAITNTSVGRVMNNSNLTDGAAKVILNEVVSNQASGLNGFIEVAGQKADVIIANPNGIGCNGCSFVNVGQATLTTGQTLLHEDGSLAGFRVTGGNITVGGKGLNHKDSYVELMAKAIQINGQITADTVSVTGGGFDYDYVNKATFSHGTMPGLWDMLSPSYVIDVAHLGGIKANQIQLIGTSKGFGVRNAGNILGEQALNVNSLGVIENTGKLSSASGTTKLFSLQNLYNAGEISAGNNLYALSVANIYNDGKFNAPLTEVYYMGKELVNRGEVNSTVLYMNSVGVNNQPIQGKIINSGIMNTQVGNISAVEINQQREGKIVAGQVLNVDATSVHNDGKLSGGNVVISGALLNNAGLIQAKGNMAIALSGKLTNLGTISAANEMSLTIDKLENYGNCSWWWCTEGNISAHKLTVNSPSIKSLKDLSGNVTASALEIKGPLSNAHVHAVGR
jgi:filamentous hemagglutinin family protein